MQYADNPFFTNAVTVEPLFENFYTLPPLDSGKWYWRVLALDPAGNASDWSMVASLTVGGGGSDCSFAPDPPELQKPEYGDEVPVLDAKLKIAPLKDKDWKKQDLMTQWQVCETDTFDQLTLDGVLDNSNTSFRTPHLSLLPDFTYNWRVRYVSIDGCSSAWSEVSLFDTGLGPVDFNMNGIPDEQEVDLSVDLDDNLVADVQQTDIKCVTTLTGGQMGVSIVEPVDAVLEAVAAMDADCVDDGKDLPDMNLGLVSFRIRVVHPGDSAKLTLYLSETAHNKARLYRCDPNIGLLDYSTNAEFSADRTSVTMIVEDGGVGDADGTVNQVIVVTAGPGVYFPPPSAMGSAVNITESIIDITESIINNEH